MCYPVCGMVHIKESMLQIENNSASSGVSGFPFCLSDPSPYAQCHIAIDKHILSASLNKIFLPSFPLAMLVNLHIVYIQYLMDIDLMQII